MQRWRPWTCPAGKKIREPTKQLGTLAVCRTHGFISDKVCICAATLVKSAADIFMVEVGKRMWIYGLFAAIPVTDVEQI